ncbi:alpha/beta hydrolase [Hymenobacter lutimineralis]|uniref:Alpha/beta hydrolase n=1 Tax=Hymenobacter lutimineralis TaxID=2606448 RepID=A0A5D6UXS4_9BACT|nr:MULTISPECIES: alpha/beta hydrolase [Hymenobacter]QIX60521.1 alpha/beta hydrolase [Hymenobacter sp. BT18]TYZ07402.1 alpha/beta hydrolase [Hymenobacter lutimineralis]
MKTLRPNFAFLIRTLCGLLLTLVLLQTATAGGLPNGTPAFQTSDGVKLFVKVAGQGLPCLFVHGGPGAGSQAVEVLAGAPLEKQLQMIYLDQRGSGRSASDPQKNYSLERQVQDMEELRQQLKLEKWTLMAHSFGGILATTYAQKYPGRVHSLILVNAILNLPASMESTTAYGYTLLPAATRPPLDAAAPLPQRYFMVTGLLQRQGLYNQLQYASDSSAARVSRTMKGQPANHDFAANMFQNPGNYLLDYTPATASLAMPVLVLTGQQDYVTGPEHYKSFRFPQQQVVVLPGKHVPFLDNPQEFNQAVQRFVRQLPRKS